MITLEHLEKYFTIDNTTGNLTFKDPEGVIPGFKLIFVQGGGFKSCDGITIKLSSFYIAEFQITQEIYIAVTGKQNPSRFQGINHPVEQVSWFGAVDFCNVFNSKIGLPPIYDKDYNFLDINGKKLTLQMLKVSDCLPIPSGNMRLEVALNEETSQMVSLLASMQVAIILKMLDGMTKIVESKPNL